MKYQILTFVAMLTVAFAMPTSSLSAQKDVSADIRKANENFMKLFHAGDVDKFVTVYTEDARLLPPNGPMVTGIDNVKTLWGGMMAAGITLKLKTVSADGYGKTAVEEGTAEIFAGDEVVDNLKYMIIWKKVKGVWKLHKDIWNSDNPVPEN